jgi:hypothetical protein
MKDLEGKILINFVNVFSRRILLLTKSVNFFPGIYFLDIYKFAGTDKKILKNFYQVIRYSCLILYEKIVRVIENHKE